MKNQYPKQVSQWVPPLLLHMDCLPAGNQSLYAATWLVGLEADIRKRLASLSCPSSTDLYFHMRDSIEINEH